MYRNRVFKTRFLRGFFSASDSFCYKSRLKNLSFILKLKMLIFSIVLKYDNY